MGGLIFEGCFLMLGRGGFSIRLGS